MTEAGGAVPDTPVPSVRTPRSAPGLGRHGNAGDGGHDGPHAAPSRGRRGHHHRDEPNDLHREHDLRRHEHRHPDEPGEMVLVQA